MRTEVVYYGSLAYTVAENGVVWNDYGKRLIKAEYEGKDVLLSFEASGVYYAYEPSSFIDAAFNGGVVKRAGLNGMFMLTTDGKLENYQKQRYTIGRSVGKTEYTTLTIDHAEHHTNPARRIPKKEDNY